MRLVIGRVYAVPPAEPDRRLSSSSARATLRIGPVSAGTRGETRDVVAVDPGLRTRDDRPDAAASRNRTRPRTRSRHDLEKANPAAPIAQMRRDMLEIKTEIAAIRQDIRDLVGLLRMPV